MVKIIRETQYEKMMEKVVEPGLAAMREEIDMPLSSGGTLHAEVYNRYDAKKAVVMLMATQNRQRSCARWRGILSAAAFPSLRWITADTEKACARLQIYR